MLEILNALYNIAGEMKQTLETLELIINVKTISSLVTLLPRFTLTQILKLYVYFHLNSYSKYALYSCMTRRT